MSATTDTRPVVLSYGLGADSTAILLRWLLDPTSRNFDLSQLIVITAMVGDEFDETGRLAEAHILPMLRERGVRFAQVARGGRLEKDGIVVLDDSTNPERLYLKGAYKLSDELRHALTVPQYRAYARKCSIKFKGWVLDTFIERTLGDQPFRHVIGFESEETKRAERDVSYSTEQRDSEYPLIEWGWDRQQCIDYIKAHTGVVWPKSCCVFCPFSQGNAEHLARLNMSPDRAMETMLIEHMSLAFNPRQHSLPGATTFRQKLVEAGYLGLLVQYKRHVSRLAWGVYRVRRVSLKKGSFFRSIERVTPAALTEGHALLVLSSMAEAEGAEVVFEEGSNRAHVRKRGTEHPMVEDMLVACPAQYGPDEELHPGKTMSSFAKHWATAMRILQQRESFTLPEKPTAKTFYAPVVSALYELTKGRPGVGIPRAQVVQRVLDNLAIDPEQFGESGRRDRKPLVMVWIDHAFRNQRPKYKKKSPTTIAVDPNNWRTHGGLWGLTEAGVAQAAPAN